MNSANIQETEKGILIPVKVIPKSREEKIAGWENGSLKIKVRSPPEKGVANKAIVRLLAELLSIPQKNIFLIKGKASRYKILLIKEIEYKNFLAKIGK